MLMRFVQRQRQVKNWHIDVVLSDRAIPFKSLRASLIFMWLRVLFKRNTIDSSVVFTASLAIQDPLEDGIWGRKSTWNFHSEGHVKELHKYFNLKLKKDLERMTLV